VVPCAKTTVVEAHVHIKEHTCTKQHTKETDGADGELDGDDKVTVAAYMYVWIECLSHLESTRWNVTMYYEKLN
jgi:hypothetical protein